MIDTVISDIIQLAKDSDWENHQGVAEALLTLSNDGKTANIFVPALFTKIIVNYRPLIQTAIPGIAELLRGSRWVTRWRAAKVLSKLSEQGETSQ